MSQERVSGFPEKGADLRGSPGNFWGSLGNFRGSLGNFRGTSGLLLSSTVRELPGKSPKNFRGKFFGELPGKSGDFPEARGNPTPSQRLAKFVSGPIFPFFSAIFFPFRAGGPIWGLYRAIGVLIIDLTSVTPQNSFCLQFIAQSQRAQSL